MAALTIAAGVFTVTALSIAAPVQDNPADGAPASASGAAEGGAVEKTKANPNAHKVKLELRIAGLGPQGCDVEIKPGHPGCKFQTKTRHVDARGWATLLFNDVQLLNADRDCTFAITIREPGQAERTVRRGLRLAAVPGNGSGPGELLTCYLSSPSKLAKSSETPMPKR
jgi:hypothetical protein